jgi:hypothetical protein
MTRFPDPADVLGSLRVVAYWHGSYGQRSEPLRSVSLRSLSVDRFGAADHPSSTITNPSIAAPVPTKWPSYESSNVQGGVAPISEVSL